MTASPAIEQGVGPGPLRLRRLDLASTAPVDVLERVALCRRGAVPDESVRAGARAILVPNALTRSQEVADAPVVADSLLEAAELVLGGRL